MRARLFFATLCLSALLPGCTFLNADPVVFVNAGCTSYSANPEDTSIMKSKIEKEIKLLGYSPLAEIQSQLGTDRSNFDTLVYSASNPSRDLIFGLNPDGRGLYLTSRVEEHINLSAGFEDLSKIRQMFDSQSESTGGSWRSMDCRNEP